MNQIYAVHASLPRTTVWVDSAVFYDMTVASKWVKASVFGITCLPGRVPTFEVLTAEGYIFSEVPPHLIQWKEDVTDALPLASLVYNNCLSLNFSLSHFEALAERKALAYFKEENRYLDAQYWFSLDYFENNNWFHCMKLANGQVAFLPSHKLVFPAGGSLPEGHKFPQYLKLRQEFKV